MLLKGTLPESELRIYDPHQQVLNDIGQLLQIYQRQYFYPLIFMPLTSKLYTYAEKFKSSITQEGKKLLQQASEIYLIRYNAKDDIIRDFLLEAPKDTFLHVVKHKTDSSWKTMNEVLGWAKNLRPGLHSDVGFYNFANRITIR
jgi:hypothetical protein